MNKAELVEALVKETKASKAEVERALNTFLAVAVKGLLKDGELALAGFGKLAVKKRAARTGINPLTKAKVKIPAKKTVSFKAAKALKDKANAKK